MPPAVFSTTSFAELEQFMLQTLCQHERLEAGLVQVKRTLMRQGAEIIGLVIRVQGPRLMRSHAIWADRENRILFYNSAGHRFGMVKLSESPEISQVAA